MIDLPTPGPLFNPLTAPVDDLLTGWEILAGPFGLFAFFLFIPALRLAARGRPRAALTTVGLAWVFATAGPWSALLILAFCLAGMGWVSALGSLVRNRRIPARVMVALVWIGLAAMISPLWWYAQWTWYGWHEPSRLAPLHNLGFAYLMVRMVAWGVQLSKQPTETLRPIDTLCWLLYPPCMRLGPVMLREDFLAQLERWDPREPVPVQAAGRRFALFGLGVLGIGAVGLATPHVQPGAPDFLSSPEAYSTGALLAVFYLVPIQLYLLLWTYNELAAALALWVGIPVADNFNWLPCATSVRDFWRRWHTTLGVWLRDYIYIPLGGNRGIVPLHYVAVFGFCGVWHGASWCFLVWGGLQVFGLMVQRQWDRLWDRLGPDRRPSGRWWSVLCWLATMHYLLIGLMVFVDFDYVGLRFFRELGERLLELVR